MKKEVALCYAVIFDLWCHATTTYLSHTYDTQEAFKHTKKTEKNRI